MKRTGLYVTAAIVAALSLGMMAGCSSQPASSANASSASASASAAAQKSQDEIIAELKDAVAKAPEYKSVTITEQDRSWLNSHAEAAGSGSSAAASSESTADETIEAKVVYKFDASGDTLKTSSAFEMQDIAMQYFTDGDKAVCVTDGPVYSGTPEQFGLTHAAGAEALIEGTIGDLESLINCTSSVTQVQADGVTTYELTLDPEKYIESDEILKMMADSNDPITEARITVGFDKDGRIVSMSNTSVFTTVTSVKTLDLSDYDSTVVDPMPEATRTYEEMEADMQAKIDTWIAESEEADGETASAPAELK